MNIVFLDAKSIGEDIDLSLFDGLGNVIKYDFTTEEEVSCRAEDADVLIVNKVEVNERTIKHAVKLKLVCVTATGTNNLDKEYLAQRNIAWRNVAGYSTDSVAQHTFALLFYLFEKLSYYDAYVKEEKYVEDRIFTHFAEQFHELKGKTWGIVGMGAIGQKVAALATAFGCSVLYYSTSGKNSQKEYEKVSFQEILQKSDILSIHAPLNEDTLGLMNKEAFLQMKNTAILINVGRGAIIVEEDLVFALEQNQIAAAGLDVLCEEPMSRNNPLIRLKDSKKLLITPHIAWASVEARTRLMKQVYEQVLEVMGS